jgi:hypothetical protein
MSDLKFSCPSCGQHIQCDETHAGKNLPCPDCAHLIRVPNNAEIIREAPVSTTTGSSAIGAGNVPTLDENLAGASLPTDPPMTEREHELAAARAAHATQATQVVKPRLSFILSGGEAPAREENESALSSPEQKNSEHHAQEAKTIHE